MSAPRLLDPTAPYLDALPADFREEVAWARAELDELVRQHGMLADRYPALARWRKAVLRGSRVSERLTRAAAWELTALACEHSGDMKRALEARGRARRAVMPKATGTTAGSAA